MTSTSTRLTGARKLNVVKTLAGHEPYFVDGPDGERTEVGGPAISYFPDGQKMISGCDKTARLWNLKESKEIEEARVVCEQRVLRVAVSRDSRWVAVGCENGELKACEVNTGVIKPFKGHSSHIMTMDISRDGKLLVSGSFDATMIWDLEVGNLVTTTSPDPAAVRFSQDSKKLVIMTVDNFEVWSIDSEARKLEIKIQKNYHTKLIPSPCQWTTDDRTIIAACSLDSRDRDPKTIYEIDSSTLEIVGAPFQGHTNNVRGLELSFDCALLVSVSGGHTVKLWAFESRHLLASFDIRHIVVTVALSPDARQLVYTTSKPGQRRIYICNIPPDILAELRPGEEAHGSNVRQNGDPLNSDATARRSAAKQRILAPVPGATQQLGRSPSTHQQDSFLLRYIRTLLPRQDEVPAIAVEPCDPLDCPATSPRVYGKSSSVPTTNLMDHSSGANSGDVLPISQSANRSSSSISRLRHLFNWHPARHALPPIIDVPLTQGQKRNAAAGAPKRDDRYVRDEDFDSRPTSPVSTFQNPPSGDNGTQSRRLCSCF